MTEYTLKKLHKHFTFLTKGNFSATDFNKEFGDGEDSGFAHMGKLTPDRVKLIISDAEANLKDLEKKYPFLKEQTIKSKKKE